VVKRRIAFRCDVGASTGVGHLMRSVALAEELSARHVEPVFFADVDTVPWAAEQLTSRAYPVHRAPVGADDHVAQFASGGFYAVVFDSYRLAPHVYHAVRRTGMATLALVDGALRGAEADLLVDQNMGAEHDEFPLPQGATRLAGLRYALLRDEVLAQRPAEPITRPVAVPRVLAVFGGTDAVGAGPSTVEALAATGHPFDLTTVVPREELRTRAAAVRLSAGQSLRLVPPTNRFAELVRSADLVVSAAGTSTWELLCLGACAALVCVVDNQATGYRRLTAAGLAAGLGTATELRDGGPGPTRVLSRLLCDPVLRQSLAQAAWRSIDGQGRHRVTDALIGVCTSSERGLR